jgi:phosphonate transport system substrate-binding protein
MGTVPDEELRCTTWLAPGLPLELFQFVVDALGRRLGCVTSLRSETASSGPDPEDDPFARDEVDVGFLCGPSLRRLSARSPESVEPVAAPVFDDPRNGGSPTYFAELVVRDDVPAGSLAELAGRRIGYNDPASRSGHDSLIAAIEAIGRLPHEFAPLVPTGGHLRSLELIAAGEIDAAAIDSNTLLGLGGTPAGTRVVETWGPFPVQPVVVRSALPEARRAAIAAALCALHEDDDGRALSHWNVRHFAPIDAALYA